MNVVGFLTVAGLALFLFCLFLPDNSDDSALLGSTRRIYNDTYPLTSSISIGKDKKFKICVIADPDKKSRNEDQVNRYKIGSVIQKRFRKTMSEK